MTTQTWTEVEAGAAEVRYAELLACWRDTVPARSGDEERFATMRAEVDDLVDRGLWVSGPADLLTVLGKQWQEVYHSGVLAWLVDPTGRHGLSRRFLQRLLATLWPTEELAAHGPISVDTEVSRTGDSDETGETLGARADVVVSADGFVLVIENKVWAGEGGRQCERLYWSWVDAAPDVRWVFLTPAGSPPTTAVSAPARDAWRTLTYLQVRDALAAALADTESASHVGRETALQYLATLDAHTTFTGRRP